MAKPLEPHLEHENIVIVVSRCFVENPWRRAELIGARWSEGVRDASNVPVEPGNDLPPPVVVYVPRSPTGHPRNKQNGSEECPRSSYHAGRGPEHVALNRAELNYHFGLLSAGQAAVNSANRRIDHLINAIQDIRRKNFTTSLFQPVPGIYSYQTWAKLPDYVPSATSRVRDIVADWWDGVRDQNEVLLIAFEAILLWLVLTLAGWHGVRRLRRWRHEGEPPFWRRASSAAGVRDLLCRPRLLSLKLRLNVIWNGRSPL
jgi:hypothetical protein